MEYNLHKCSSKEHLNIDSNYYCFDCKIYMYNKCDNMHSKLFQNHSKVKSDKNMMKFINYFAMKIIIMKNWNFIAKIIISYVVDYAYAKSKIKEWDNIKIVMFV